MNQILIRQFRYETLISEVLGLPTVRINNYGQIILDTARGCRFVQETPMEKPRSELTISECYDIYHKYVKE